MATNIRRRATKRGPNGEVETRWLDDWRELDAYVLLGDPGAGKSWSLASEASSAGAEVVPARFIQEELQPLAAPGQTVFIDALDEVRGSGAPGTDALGSIARWLLRSGSPRFRIACREADWRDEADRVLIARAIPIGQVSALHLEPLSKEDIEQLLRDSPERVPNPAEFMQAADHHGVLPLLGNPLLLELMIDAVANRGYWPATRLEVYEGACRTLAEEASPGHRQRVLLTPGYVEHVLQAAGMLNATLLLSGSRGIAVATAAGPADIDLRLLPLEWHVPHSDHALKSNIFSTEGGRATPRHRTIAEFLAARSISSRIVNDGLPFARVVALMLGFDGRPVEALRGLFAWLAVHLRGSDRHVILRADPLGFILNGDAAALTHAERIMVLEALSASASENRWFRAGHWGDHPFGALATSDMAGEYVARLEGQSGSEQKLAFVECLMDALRHARNDLPNVAAVVARWVGDESAGESIRLAAYEAWKRHTAPEAQSSQCIAWLDQIVDGNMQDKEDRLLGRILRDVYPDPLHEQVLRYLRPRRNRRLIAEFSEFWGHRFVKNTPPPELPALADAWISRFPNGLPFEWNVDVGRTSNQLLQAVVHHCGDHASVPRLYQWLGIGLGEYGTSRGDPKDHERVGHWLQERPNLMKELAEWGYGQVRVASREMGFWETETRLRSAKRPHDWLTWKISLAQRSADLELVHWIIHDVARAVEDPPTGLSVPSMEEVEEWVANLTRRVPAAAEWLQECWSSPLDHWRGEQHRRDAKYRRDRDEQRRKRNESFRPALENLHTGKLPANALATIARAIRRRFLDIEGNTDEELVQDLLGTDDATTAAVLASLDTVLDWGEIPSAADVLREHARGREYFLQPPALLAADRTCARTPDAWKGWNAELASSLSAMWLCDGTGEEPSWFAQLAIFRGDIVAPVLVAHALPKLRKKARQSITGLWQLSKEPARQPLAAQVIPQLLDGFPVRSSEAAREELSSSLLSNLPLLPREEAERLVRRGLNRHGIDRGQRIAWLVALLRFDEVGAISQLTLLIANQSQRVPILGHALRTQGVLSEAHPLTPASLASLIALLAPHTVYDPDWPGGAVTEGREREELVKRCIEMLGSNPGEGARKALLDLEAREDLRRWGTPLEFHLQAQRAVYREASFRPPAPEAVARILANGPPANVRDLVQVVVDQLRSIEGDLRGNPAFQLRQFWRQMALRSQRNGVVMCCSISLNQSSRSRASTSSLSLRPLREREWISAPHS